MSNTEKLVFFNKEGYPYNFRLNDGIWTGKIFFEPNSTDIFESISLYTLESVDSIRYSNTMDIVNMEIYNDSGMTISTGLYTDESVTAIRSVNQSPLFYSKWITGTNFNRKFPVGTIVSFTGNVNSGMTDGESDFLSSYVFTVVRVKRNNIMIITTTPNSNFTFTYDQLIHNLKVTARNCVTIPDFDRNLETAFPIKTNEKISIVGSTNNDGVYEVDTTGYTISRILDYNISSFLPGDIMTINLNMLTERQMLYNGNIDLTFDGTTLRMEFLNGKNSNITVGKVFMCEDSDGQHLINGTEYTIQSIETEKVLDDLIYLSFSGYSYEEASGEIVDVYQVMVPTTLGIKINDDIKFESTIINHGLNNGITRRVMDIETGGTFNTLILNSHIHTESGYSYSLIKVLKPHEQNQVVVTNTTSDYTTYNGYAVCMSTSNIITYNQEVPITGYTEALDNLISRYSADFYNNGVDLYRIDNTLYFDGLYGGQNRYFDVQIIKNGTSIISPNGTYTDLSGNTSVYHILLLDQLTAYEVTNMSDQLSTPYSADIILDIYDDAQDYGFQLGVNGVQYYIPFNDDSGTTSYTLETIKSFIDLYGDAFGKNGLDLSYGTTISGSTTINHLYVEGQEPNIHIWEMKVKVNTNSSYSIVENADKSMMVTSNRIVCSSNEFITVGFSTGMIVSVSGATYPLNNKEFNIINISQNTMELSYQGPMYSETSANLRLVSREHLRRPRESNDIDIYYRFRWEDDTDDTIFLYDLSGDNLVPYGDNPDYTYIGPKPLCVDSDTVILNYEPNKNINYIDVPARQQTVFDELNFLLEKFNDDNISILPHPIQTFIGYNSKKEGVNQRNLIVERADNVSYTGYADGSTLFFVVNGNTLTVSGTSASTINLLEMGFKSNRYVRMRFDDLKPYTQEIFENYNDYLVYNVTKNSIIFYDTLSSFTTKDNEFEFELMLMPERIAYFSIFGETEEEDERYKSNLQLLGINLAEGDEYIFKQSDIKEDGIDYRLLNRKRKEMLNIFPEIYNYVGSYKAILNSIDFFGYTDVELIEYYKNIDPNSPYYDKLKRVVISDMMDRQVDGWTYEEDLVNRPEYIKTNLFNLTYRITDEEGNNVYLYTLKDVQTKLNGLKNWLRRNVIPVNSNVRDITGISEVVSTLWRRFDPCVNVNKNVVSDSNEGVNFNYTATRSFNDSWLIEVSFYTVNDVTPSFFDLKVITYTKDWETGILYPQQRWDVYKTDMNNFNFSINWDGFNESVYDQFFYIKTTKSNDRGLTKSVDKMYNLEDGSTYYFDEYKNYVLINNNFRYKYYNYMQNKTNVYIVDEYGNIYVIDKPTENVV